MHLHRCSHSAWKCSLLLGSVVSWILGIIVFSLCLSTVRNPVFHPSLMSVSEPVYSSLAVAFAGGIFICFVAFVGCCGAACRSPAVLMLYGLGLIVLFIYQVVDGISLLYQATETFPYLQFLSVELCEHQKRMDHSRQGRYMPEEVLVESITRAVQRARQFNKDVALLLGEQKAQGFGEECVPMKDILTPTAALLFVTSIVYIYLGYCAVNLCLHLRSPPKRYTLSRNVKFQMEENGPTLEEDLENLPLSSQVQFQRTPAKSSTDSVFFQKTYFTPPQSSLVGLETKTTVVQIDRIFSDHEPSPVRPRPKSPARSLTVFEQVMNTPENSISSFEQYSIQRSTPLNSVPVIVILSPTPDRKCSDS